MSVAHLAVLFVTAGALVWIIGMPIVCGWCKSEGDMAELCAVTWPLWVPFWFVGTFVFSPLYRIGERYAEAHKDS